jgi:hypothetical protein
MLFPAGTTSEASGCPPVGAEGEQIRCLLALRWSAASASGRADAIGVYDALGSVLGLEEPGEMDGGYRGRIHIVPELPVGRYARHLGWVVSALREHDAFFAALGVPTPALGAEGGYRHAPIGLLFFRSVGKHTPAAYAGGWQVAYNVEGSINTSAQQVRETLFHEIFHLNDAAHGGWSARALGGLYDGIVGRCGVRTACLAPYAPHSTTVRGGTYYAFQPGNGVGEYAAELATRYYIEQRAALAGKPPARPFKCGPAENARAHALLADEFFGGVDHTPPCR